MFTFIILFCEQKDLSKFGDFSPKQDSGKRVYDDGTTTTKC